MTTEQKILELYKHNDIVTICMVSANKFKNGEIDTIEHILDKEVLSLIPPIKNYQNYSHGICKPCAKEYYGITLKE